MPVSPVGSRELVASGVGPAWRDLLVEVYRSAELEVHEHMPGVPEPQLVHILQGTILFEERDPGRLARP